MEKYSNLKANDERKDIVLTNERKKDLNEVINNQINKTEYFLFKLKSTL